MDLLGFGMTKMVTFLLVLCRVGGIFTLAPIFGNQNVSKMVRITIAVALTLIFVPMISYEPKDLNMVTFFVLIVKETLVGVLMGFLATMMFTAIVMAGAYIDLAIGLSFAQQVDPLTKAPTAVMGMVLNLVATLVFLGVNGHHVMIRGLAESFDIIPIGKAVFTPEAANGLLVIFGALIMAALKIAAPLIGVIFIVDIALGILARTVPQMNIFSIGFAMKLIVGLGVMIIILPATSTVMVALFSGLHRDLMMLLRHLV